MKFKKNTRRKALEYEKDLVQYWKDNRTFEKSVEQRPESNSYVFYDGPPFITGSPHIGNLLTFTIKDAVPRYWTMKGKRVERVWGWDCHGLPAEIYTQKKLGITDRQEIGTTTSLEDYIVACRKNMIQTGSEWEDLVGRIGRWVDFKGAYTTMDKEFMESVWWAFKQLYEKGKIYEGERVLMYCTRDATPVSKAEVAMDNSYKDITDPSVYVKFKLLDNPSFPRSRLGKNKSQGEAVYLLAWTTTPWTLPSNSAIAVNEKLTYVEVKVGDEVFIMAKSRLDHVLTDEKHKVLAYDILREFSGEELVGLEYEPIFEDAEKAKNAYKVWHADFVHDEDGTGIAHESPAYGEDDYILSKKLGFPMFMNTDEEGFYTSGEWKGKLVWDVNKDIAKTLHERGVVWKIDYIKHSYPHCWRCETKLMYRAHPSWFMDIDGQRTEMLAQNEPINWFPEHIKHGHFENTVLSAPDWNLSRDRFWATAIPVWKGTDKDGNEKIKVVGSYDELFELSGKRLEDYHRPWVDDVTFTIDDVEYRRIDKVIDCWFESGSMPFAQFHYPFENVDKFEQNFPGDFIVEYMPQVRAWFYNLHAVSVGIFDKPAFKNVIAHGTLAGNDGRKMSKSLGNYTDPNILMDTYSADALRFFLLSSPISNGEDVSLVDKDVADINRKLAMVWNMYDFFTLYADVDGWEFKGEVVDPTSELTNLLDLWIVSRVHQLNHDIDKHMQGYDLPNATKQILPFIDDASNWYVRRSRKRFWKSDSDADKQLAYKTLHYTLVHLSQIVAPFTPFLAEELYRKLTGGESVHLLDWPEVGHVNEMLITDMALTRDIITNALSERAKAGIKVRQPLASLKVISNISGLDTDMVDIIQEEVNVKLVEVTCDLKASSLHLELDTKITPALKSEGLSREVIRQVQEARKSAGLDIDDRIDLGVKSDDADLGKAIKTHAAEIQAETLAKSLNTAEEYTFETEVKIEARSVLLLLGKVV